MRFPLAISLVLSLTSCATLAEMKYRLAPRHTIEADEQIRPGFGAVFFRATYITALGDKTREMDIGSFYKEAMERRVPEKAEGFLNPKPSLSYYGASFVFMTQGSPHEIPAKSGPNLFQFPAGIIHFKRIRSSGSYPVSNGTMNLWKEAELSIHINVKAGEIVDIGHLTVTEDILKREIRCSFEPPAQDDAERASFIESRYPRSNIISFPVVPTEGKCTVEVNPA